MFIFIDIPCLLFSEIWTIGNRWKKSNEENSQSPLRTSRRRCPTTCEDKDKNCGEIGNGCGDVISCGTCQENYTCSDNNICKCIPKVTSCSHECGVIDNGCGDTVTCGDGCVENEICEDFHCVCIPSVISCGLECGTIDDGCD